MKHPIWFLVFVLVLINAGCIWSYYIGKHGRTVCPDDDSGNFIASGSTCMATVPVASSSGAASIDLEWDGYPQTIDMNEPMTISIDSRGDVGIFYPATNLLDITDMNCLTNDTIRRAVEWWEGNK